MRSEGGRLSTGYVDCAINNVNVTSIRRHHGSLWLYWITAPLCFSYRQKCDQRAAIFLPEEPVSIGNQFACASSNFATRLSLGVIYAIFLSNTLYSITNTLYSIMFACMHANNSSTTNRYSIHCESCFSYVMMRFR